MLKVAVTDCPKHFDAYTGWLCASDETVQCMKLSPAFDNLHAMRECGGLLLTGGGDVSPVFYYRKILEGKGMRQLPEDISHLIPQGEKEKIKHIDEKRDAFERQAIEEALKMRIPILGICRGLQIANVVLGGTLVRDLGDRNEEHTKKKVGDDDKDSKHEIAIEGSSFLKSITGLSCGIVNSAHHQAAEEIGESLSVSARSNDGVIEALEFKKRNDYPFFLLVQWHPERMKDTDNPLCENIRVSFISSIKGGQA